MASKYFLKMAEQVYQVEPKAIIWLLYQADLNRNRSIERVSQAFTWADSPQGSVFWRRVADKIDEAFPHNPWLDDEDDYDDDDDDDYCGYDEDE